MPQEQTPSNFAGGSKAKTVQPDTSFGDVSLIESLQQSLPKYQGSNPYTLKNKLIRDDKFFDEFTTDFFEVTETPQIAQLREEAPEQYQALNQRFKKNFRRDLTKTSYTGETEKDTLVSRTLQFRKNTEDISIETYKDIVSSNPEKYEKFGLFSDGEFLFGDDKNDNLTFAQNIVNDEELHGQIVRDHFDEYQKTLANKYNNPEVLSDPTKQAQAWVIFDKFGSEGLTQYINLLQAGEEGAITNEKFTTKEKAQQFFANSEIDGKTAFEHIEDFVVGSSVQDVEFADQINQSSQYGVAPSLLAGMIRQESNFNPQAVSDSGAVGLVQLMPAAAREAGLKVPDELYELDVERMKAKGAKRRTLTEQLARKTKQLSTPENDERLDPEKSIEVASKQLGQRMQRYNYDPEKVVASWNAGMGRVDKAVEDSTAVGRSWKEFIPQDETAPHIEKVMNYASEYGAASPLSFKPVQPRQELTTNVPEDLNEFTALFYGVEDGEFKDKDPNEVSTQFLKKFAPENYQKFLDTKNLSENGEYSDEFGQLTWNVYKWASQNDAIKDLTKTVKLAGEYNGSEEDPTYRINYAQLSPKEKIALNALRYDDEGDYMVQFVANGVYDFRPKRREVAQSNVDYIKNLVYNTKEEFYRDENGDLQVREVPEKGGLTGLWNSVATAALGLADWGMRYFYEPMIRTGGKLTGHEGTRAYADALRDWTGVDLAEGLTAETDGIVPNAIGEVAPFIQYMGAMMVGGSALFRAGTKAVGAITNAKKLYDMQRYAGRMLGSQRIGAIAQKLQHAVKNKEPWTLGARLYAGGAAVEATQPQEVSFLNTVPQLLGYEPTNKLTEKYKLASDIQQTAMDIGASLMVDGFFDTILASTKIGAAKLGSREKFKGIRYVGDEGAENFGGFEVVDTPQFRHELREFWHNMTTDLDKLPIGSVGETMAKGFTKGMKPSTLHDFTKSFVDDSEWLAKDVRKDIRDNVTMLNRSLGGEQMSPSQIDDIVAEQYDSFLQSTAQQMHGILRTSSSELPLKMADTLEQQVSQVKEFRPNGEAISPLQIKNYPDKNLIEKGGKVYEVDPQYWTIDLADKLRRQGLRATQEDVATRKVDEIANPTDEQIETIQFKSEFIGTPVEKNGRFGYVIDFDENNYIVRDSNGDTFTIKNVSEISEDKFNDFVRQATNNEMVRKRLLLRDFDSLQRNVEPRAKVTTWEEVQNPETGKYERRSVEEVSGTLKKMTDERGRVHEYIETDNGQKLFVRIDGKLLPKRENLVTETPINRNVETTPTKLLPESGTQPRLTDTERELLMRVDEIQGRIGTLQNRHRNLDDIVDDPKARGNQRREITREVKELQQQKEQAQRELSRFYIDNPEVQGMRKHLQEMNTVRLDERLNQQYSKRFKETADQTGKLVNKQLELNFC